MRDRLKLLVFVGIIGTFALTVLLFMFTAASGRLIGGLLLAVGLVAIAGARGAAAAAAQPKVVRAMSLGSRTESSLRPGAFRLWGAGVALLGFFLLLGV